MEINVKGRFDNVQRLSNRYKIIRKISALPGLEEYNLEVKDDEDLEKLYQYCKENNIDIKIPFSEKRTKNMKIEIRDIQAFLNPRSESNDKFVYASLYINGELIQSGSFSQMVEDAIGVAKNFS